MKTPSLEEVKEYFKNAETVKCLSDGGTYKVDFSQCIDRFPHGIYIYTDPKKSDSYCVYNPEKGYAKILTYKKPIRTNKLIELEKRVDAVEVLANDIKKLELISQTIKAAESVAKQLSKTIPDYKKEAKESNPKILCDEVHELKDVKFGIKTPTFELLLKAIKEGKIEIPNTEKAINELKNYKPFSFGVDWGFGIDKSVVSAGGLRSGKQHFLHTFDVFTKYEIIKSENNFLKKRIEELEAEKEVILKGTLDNRKINDVELPIASKNVLKVGKWYKSTKSKTIGLFKGNNVESCGLHGGINWIESHRWFFDENIFDGGNWTEATQEEVFEALKNEAVKRGYKEGVRIKSSFKDERIKTCESNIYYNGFAYNQLLFGHYCCVFNNGKWAEIIPTITKEQPEKELGKTEKKTITGWYKHSKKEFPRWLMFIDFEKESFYGFDADGKSIKDTWKFTGMISYFEHTKLIPAKKSEVIKRLSNEVTFDFSR